MRADGYDDVERGERGSSEEHLTATQFKVEQEQHRLDELNAARTEAQIEIVHLQEEKTDAQSEAKAAKTRLDDIAPKVKTWRSWQLNIPMTRKIAPGCWGAGKRQNLPGEKD